jgi:hypothetical protein
MGGALLQLLAVGKQDAHFIGNPQISFFKKVFKRHTHYSIEPISQNFSETPHFGNKTSCIIDKKGDLLSDIYLEIQLPALQANVSWINGIGHHIIKTVELLLGGEKIVTLTGEYIDMYSELRVPSSKKLGYYNMIGKKSKESYNSNSYSNSLNLFVPLPFWFCTDLSNALPIISLQYTQIRVDIEFRPFSDSWYSGTSMSTIPSDKQITNAYLVCDYIYLDTFERKQFAQLDTEYLIEQVQISNNNTIRANTTSKIIELYFNHPIKELMWIYQITNVSSTNDWSNYSRTIDNDSLIQIQINPIIKSQLKFNGIDRIEDKLSEYFLYVQPYKKHTSIPDNFIFVYSFSNEPENDTQPTGSCNFSKIDNSEINFTFANNIPLGEVKVYGINYNILKIKNGMAGLLYSS